MQRGSAKGDVSDVCDRRAGLNAHADGAAVANRAAMVIIFIVDIVLIAAGGHVVCGFLFVANGGGRSVVWKWK